MNLAQKLTAGCAIAIMTAGAYAQKFPTIHPDEVIAKYGKPDRVESTEYERPRPPIVTRALEYRKERVRFVFFPDAAVGSPPPYGRWKLMGMQDPRDNSVLSAAEVTRRMSGRARN